LYIIRYEMRADLLRPFETIPYFTIEGFRQTAGMDMPDQARVLLHRWVKAGRILRLKKGVYMTQLFFEQHSGDPAFSAAVSAILLPQSYLSLDYVLQQHNILTEVTYPVTCVTTKNTKNISNSVGTFWYRHIRADLYHGYTISEYLGVRFAEASLAKALFDYLYLRPIPVRYRYYRFNLSEELRLNLELLSTTDREEFAHFVEASGSRKMGELLVNFRRNTWRL
jgi:predicted transcriptional regulator of viral defense system